MQIIIGVPDSLPKEILKHKIMKIEADLKKEAEALKKTKSNSRMQGRSLGRLGYRGYIG